MEFAREIERIRAEERTQFVNDAAASSGNLSKGDAQKHMKELERVARGGDKEEVVKPTREMLAQAGIGVRTP